MAAHRPGMNQSSFPTLVIDEPTAHVYRGYETASFYDLHTLHPGTYEPRAYRNGQICPPDINPDRVIYRAVSTLEHTHRVVSSTEQPKAIGAIDLSFYPSELKPDVDFRGPGRLIQR